MNPTAWRVGILSAIGCFCLSCASLYPVAGATAGAAVGSMAGPGGAAAGAISGYGIGTTLAEASGEEQENALVETLISEALTQERGIVDQAIDGIVGLIKLAALIFAILLACQIAYTFHRRNKGEKFYSAVKRKLDV